MATSDAFSLQHSDLNRFLFADVGTEANGMVLSVVSVFARLGSDPWSEATRLARLPPDEAARSLAGTIAAMPAGTWKFAEAATIAARLVALLPHEPRPTPAPPHQRGRLPIPLALSPRTLRIAAVLGCIAVAALSALWVSGRPGAGGSDRGIVAFDAIPIPPHGGAAGSVPR